MKTIILAGGLGSRLSEETVTKPKPMVEIASKPILWHIMQIYSAYGFSEFVVALGYRGETIKEYFLDFFALNNDLTIDLSSGECEIHEGRQPGWKVHLVDTGLETQTGGRIRRLRKWMGNETFMLTYGDGLADVDIPALIEFHVSHGKLATVTAVRPPSRFGTLCFNGDSVIAFTEKPQIGEGWINGGFFVLEPGVFEFIDSDQTIWERDPLEKLARDNQLAAFKHEGFFHPMDTLRDKRLLESMWNAGSAPWKIWK